jgi:hypothetical protein
MPLYTVTLTRVVTIRQTREVKIDAGTADSAAAIAEAEDEGMADSRWGRLTDGEADYDLTVEAWEG